MPEKTLPTGEPEKALPVADEEAEASFERIASKRHWFDARIYECARSYLDALR